MSINNLNIGISPQRNSPSRGNIGNNNNNNNNNSNINNNNSNISTSSLNISSPITSSSPTRRFTSPSSSSNKSIIYSDRFIPSRISSHLDGGLISSYSPDSNIENENRVIHSIIRSELLGQGDGIINNSPQNSSSNVLRYHSSIDDIERYSNYSSQATSPGSTTSMSPTNSTTSYRSTSLPNIGSPTRISNSFEPSSTSLGGSAKKPKRKISRVPYKVLDAPALQDDFYLNLVDWSKSNVLAVALGSCVYLWSAYTSKVVKLHDFATPESDSSISGTVTSVCWMNGGTHLGIGTSGGRIQVWDTTKSCKVRELHPHGGRVGSLAWNQQYCLLASGSKDKKIFLQDARIRGVFSPSRHINPESSSSPSLSSSSLSSSTNLSSIQTPLRKFFPIHSDSPDLKPHHPILSSRLLPYQISPSLSTRNKTSGVGFYTSPQRLLSNSYKNDEIEEDDDEEEDKEDKERGIEYHDDNDNNDDDEFSQRMVGDQSNMQDIYNYEFNFDAGSGNRRVSGGKQSLSPYSSLSRRGDGIPPLPPSNDKKITRLYKSSSLVSESVFGQNDEDDMMMLEQSYDESDDVRMKNYLEREEADESPVLRVYETMEEKRSAAKFHSDTFNQWRNELEPSNLLNYEQSLHQHYQQQKQHQNDNDDNDNNDEYDEDNEDGGEEDRNERINKETYQIHDDYDDYNDMVDYDASIDNLISNSNTNQLSPPRETPHSLSYDTIPPPTYFPKYNASPSSLTSRNSNSLSPNDFQFSNDNTLMSPPSVVHELLSHKQEVCGLKWSFDDKQLASGGNDNKLYIWNVAGLSVNERSKQNKRDVLGQSRNCILTPEHSFSSHTAAVKAIAWSPHQSGLLVSGGGTADRHMRFWNTQTGQSLHSLDTGSQVCNLMWSTHSNEIVSTHGYSLNQIAIWKYPSLHKLATLTGHTYRVLYLAMSPNGQSIVTGAGDETLRFWNVFPGSKTPLSTGKGMLLQVGGTIR